MEQPLVSVIIPAYNGEKYIAEAIESILDQSYVNYEILVLDNGSTDQTKRIVCSYPTVNYVYLSTADTARARHRGVSLAKGEYITFLDQDDQWLKDKLVKQVGFLEHNPQYGAVIGLQKMYLQQGHSKPTWLKSMFLESPQRAYLPSALMVRRDVFDVTDNFDTHFSLASDVAWFFKAQQLGILIGILDEVIIKRRIHNDNTSNQYSALHKEILSVIKLSLQNRCLHEQQS